MRGNFLYRSWDELEAAADRIWYNLKEQDWLEAFRGHPKIGDMDMLRRKFSTDEWCSNEQKGAKHAKESVLKELQKDNEEYENHNGFIFIVCATGKSADEMLAILRQRLANDRITELNNACREQAKITKLRLEKLCSQSHL